MSLCLFRATDKKLAISDKGMGLSEISVQIQCMFTSGNALGGPPSPYIDKSKPHMAVRMVRSQGQGSGQFRFGRSKGR